MKLKAKKLLAVLMALSMLLSITAGLDFSAFAKSGSLVFVAASDKSIIENDESYGWYDDEDETFYYSIWRCFEEGDKFIYTDENGIVTEYYYDVDDLEFYSEDGEWFEFEYNSDQYDAPWGVGEHYFTVTYQDYYEANVYVSIVKNPYVSFELNSASSFVFLENEQDMGFYVYDDNDDLFYYYFLLQEGDTLVLTKDDGTTETLTFIQSPDGTGYFCFEDGKEFYSWDLYDEQWDNHFTLGTNQAVFTVFNMEQTIDITIVENPECNHYTEWRVKNGLLQKYCLICDTPISTLQFTDLKNYAAYGDYIEYTSVFNSFINGTNPPKFTLFSPTTAITRAMFVTILYRMDGAKYDGGSNPHKVSPFTDIKDTSVYYYNAACWALDNGITTQKTFKPNDLVVREQTASFLFRYATMVDCVDDSYEWAEIEEYPDFNSISSWAVDAMRWANWNGMITGTQQGYLNPKGSTQRIHATKILYGFGNACGIGFDGEPQ